jgi:hypothetical protein
LTAWSAGVLAGGPPASRRLRRQPFGAARATAGAIAAPAGEDAGGPPARTPALHAEEAPDADALRPQGLDPGAGGPPFLVSTPLPGASILLGSPELERALVESLCNQSPESAATIAAAAGMFIAKSPARNKTVQSVLSRPD